MPKSLLDWVWLIAIAFVFLFPSLASADIMDCVHRGKLAQSFAQTVAEGYDLDKINVRFQRPPANPKEQAETDKYVESVRDEVKLLLGMTPEKIGIKVAEACAFEYGKRQGFMKDVASSTSIEGPPIGAAEACSNLRYDIMLIGRAISDGKPQAQLEALARKSLPVLGQERHDRILRQIQEAYAHQGPFVEWMNKEYAQCTGNR